MTSTPATPPTPGPLTPAPPAAAPSTGPNRVLSVLTGLRRYPFLAATLTVLAGAGVLSATPQAWFVPWLLGGFALAMAAYSTVSMVRELMSGTFGIDILAVTAISAAVAVGEFWAAGVVVLMLTGGEALEDYAQSRAQRDLSALLAHAPQVAHLMDDDGSVRDAPAESVVPGDRVLVRGYEVVPVDATLVSEFGVVDESSLTGESMPRELHAGQDVMSGSVNGASSITLLVTRAAKDSQYQQIVSLVEEATASRAPMVRLADRYAVPFTLISLAIAGIAWAVSGEAIRFAEVLVVATPCPLIIAAPVAFMGGMSRSARQGAIIKSSATLEKLHAARTVAFDKTGTLTYGEPHLVEVRPEPGFTPEHLLRLGASAEQASTHTLAAAILTGAAERGLTLAAVSQAEESTAHGVTARVEQTDVVIGKRTFIADTVGRAVPRTALDDGELAVYVALDGTFAGALILRDEVRQNAAATLASLREDRIEHILMVTGDDRPTAEHVARGLGIDEVHANCLPIDKVTAIHAVTARPVVMVGDGVNDAPVLAAADVGIAMGARGATAASESADVVILRDDVSLVATAIRTGRDTVTIALQSIWIGISISVMLMLIAAFGYLPAIVGAWLQEVVDAIAILWALRAARGRTPSRDKTPLETLPAAVSACGRRS